jgi:hypothetical protein
MYTRPRQDAYGDWTVTTADKDALAELDRAVKAIVLNVFREAATATVMTAAA